MICCFQSYLPELLCDRKNFAVQSQSGSGKRIAMAILMLSHAKKDIKHPHILCIVPSLEAAWQTREAVLNVMGIDEIYTVHSAVAGMKVRIGEKLMAQILIGTPKELTVYRILGHFDPNDIDLIIIKEPDVITTTNSVKDNIVNQVKNARIILFTTSGANRNCLENIKINEFVRLDPFCELAPNVKHLFIECTSFDEKVMVLKEYLLSFNHKTIVFCQVIVK